MIRKKSNIISILSEFATKINGEVKRMYETRYGLEYRVIGIPFGNVIFRAFVPDSGYPVELDLFVEGDKICHSDTELIEEVTRYLTTLGITK